MRALAPVRVIPAGTSGPYACPPARSYRSPPQWLDAPDILKAEYCHRALQTFGQVHAFTLNLRHDIEALARSKPDPCQWLRDGIAAELRKGLGRSVEFMSVFEEADVFDEAKDCVLAWLRCP